MTYIFVFLFSHLPFIALLKLEIPNIVSLSHLVAIPTPTRRVFLVLVMPLNAQAIFPSSDPRFIPFPSRRSVVHSTNGIVACTQPLAAVAGQRILRDGGNAADAAVAVAAALNMTEPSSTGIGGDMFCLFFNSETKKVHALNGSGRAAANTSLGKIRHDLGLQPGQHGTIPMSSVHAVTTPGAAAGWVDTVEEFGSGRLSLEQILTPAIELGEEGFPVSELASLFVSTQELSP